MPYRRRRHLAAALAGLSLLAGILIPHPAAAAEESDAYSDVRLEWGVNALHQVANPAGDGCWFFSAGTQLDFAAAQGDVRIVKRLADGSAVPVTRQNVCLGARGTELGQRMQFNAGRGTIDAASGSGMLQWTGAAQANGYGGMVPWWIRTRSSPSPATAPRRSPPRSEGGRLRCRIPRRSLRCRLARPPSRPSRMSSSPARRSP
ncbi:hypothetical protein [Microbacterium sp. Se63.02b]|uniref:hypothetical protein n=1 Tax=Microbacterium sp. Se63.02b TaxID=2709304 RepID=UPI0016052359|nr:hypothetical protein [Microbacterium sp. Se63.02b]QNA91650.1 hypothetical protein G4G29_02845 [Microbacterium sp. Se63.02b]